MSIFAEPNDSVSLISKRLLMLLSLVLLIPQAVMAKEATDTQVSSQVFEVKYTQLQTVVGAGLEYQRDLNLLVSYPVGKGQYPLIVFSHGHFLDNLSYKNLTDEWVANGYVVIAPLHIDTGEMAVVSALTKEVGSDWLYASRAIDLSSIIDNAENVMQSIDGFNGTVLTDQVIAAGHSLGALSAQYLAGAFLERQNNSIHPLPDQLVDKRVVAVVAVSPPGLMPGHISNKTWETLATPQLVVTGTNDFFPQIWPNYQDHFVSYEVAPKGDNYLLVLDGMDHYLGNLIGRLERDGPPQTLALENLSRISLSFIQHYLSSEVKTNSSKQALLLSDIKRISTIDGVLRYEQR